ncbi:Clp protease ClpP [Alistipes sp.]|uniref:Clp protease ClpP n=1 Tax=Alistipes sp. TaxID=1872444 RepID=UPI003AEFF46C
MKSEIQINNAADVCRIAIEGTIGVPEEWQFENPDERVATYEKFREAVRRIGAIEAQEVVVDIRSTGGDVNDALLIHDALQQTGARITTRCYGYTASAATIIAQAASEGCREISANALYLIHTAVCATEGNAAEIAGKLDLLRQTDARIAAVYAARSGRPAAQFEALMAENNGCGRWLSPEEAVAAGLADRLIEPDELPATSLTRNLARGWERLLAAIGVARQQTLPADRNVLHFDVEEAALRQRPAAEALARIGPTTTLPREDPSHAETVRSANERAYAEDAKQLRK